MKKDSLMVVPSLKVLALAATNDIENDDNGARAFHIFDHGRWVEKNFGDLFFSDPMATYFHGNSEIQPPDGLQTLILMNPGYIQYSETPPPASSNLVFFNSSVGNPLYLPNLPHAPASQPHLVGIPLSATASSDANSLSSHSHHDVSPLHGFIQRSQNRFCSSNDRLSTVARDSARPKQGLSLTLSSHQPGYALVRIPSEAQQEVSNEDVHISDGSSSASGVSLPAVRSISLNWKYLRVAQELLDEVANVGNNGVNKETFTKAVDRRTKQEEESSALARDNNKDGVEDTAKTIPELSAAERQEIQMKKAKLINMLDEVEQRYRRYHNQMQILVSSFEQAVGVSSARTYTALALQTISKQFRCLKDTINAQIRAANNNLGKEDCHGAKLEGSKLRFLDHQFHQQQALQNLGMIQHTAWRPQRGLPERSVSVLRAWLFEHFLHPYPKDSDKQMLAKQTGLTRSQVSNWFINARVRLWKPMVEDMYMEEIKEQEQNLSAGKTSKNSANTTSESTKPTPQDKNHAIDHQLPSFNSKQDDLSHLHPPPAISFSSSATTSLEAVNVRSQSGFWLIGSSELDRITQASPKRQRIDELMQSPNSNPTNIDAKPGEANNEHISMNFNRERHGRDGYSFIGGQPNFIGGFQHYPITDIERFDGEPFTAGFSGNGVSLTLGLPHPENLTQSVANHTFLPNQNINFGRNGFDLSTYQHHTRHLHSGTSTHRTENDCCPTL